MNTIFGLIVLVFMKSKRVPSGSGSNVGRFGNAICLETLGTDKIFPLSNKNPLDLIERDLVVTAVKIAAPYAQRAARSVAGRPAPQTCDNWNYSVSLWFPESLFRSAFWEHVGLK